MPAKTKDKDKIDVEAATLVGDLRDQILGIFKSHGNWKDLKEAQQSDIIASATALSTGTVKRMAAIIAGRGFKSMQCTLASVAVKDGLKLVLTASKMSEGKNELIDHQGGSVTVVLTDINPYLGHRSEPEITPDEPRLGFEESED